MKSEAFGYSSSSLESLVTANVLDFGAKGDGVTDDTQAIQRAINFVASKHGGTVYFPGTGKPYVIAGPMIEFDSAGR